MRQKTTRRQFLAQSSAALATPVIVPAAVLGRDPEKPAPSERITMGCIGVGGRGRGNLQAFKGKHDVQIVALCDVDSGHLANGLRVAGLQPKDGYAAQTSTRS